jgi:hypothetical protein
VQHGDIYFYIQDAIYGIQNSYTKILDKNNITINIDTLQNGWQKVSIDLTKYTRTSISSIAFYMSTQDGWDSTKPFSFNLDSFSIILLLCNKKT